MSDLTEFQSTAPVWGPTLRSFPRCANCGISIHGPRVGADISTHPLRTGRTYFNPRPPCGGRPCPSSRSLSTSYFNPRPPCGGRPQMQQAAAALIGFQSTAPVWGPTAHARSSSMGAKISIHGPRVGADLCRRRHRRRHLHFNPRPPCGGRPGPPPIPRSARNFNPRPPCGGRL